MCKISPSVIIVAAIFGLVHSTTSSLDCSLIQCDVPICSTGEVVGPPPEGACCPVCVPDFSRCAAVSCIVPVCKSGQKSEVPRGECCPVCVPDCAAVSCLRPVCKPGQKLEVPEGQCCPVCVPNCTAVSCLGPLCKTGERLEVPEGECCPVCVRECEIVGQTFSECASPCPSTCEDPNPICIALCVRGCMCPPGEVVDTAAGRCIPQQLCPSNEDPCSLLPEVGPCDGIFHRYFHNDTSKRCEQFVYGGCDGNSNNFKSKSACEEQCTDLCSLPPETGPCKALIHRYFHNSTSRRCEQFIYGGCNGNSNNFKSRKACEDQCVDSCSLPPETGPCRAAFRRYFHNSTSGKCEQFIFGGCGGNSNNFESKSDCEDQCVDLGDPCSLPPETGPCRARIPRYFHNSTSGKCEQFIFGGCGGNSNNFESKSACEDQCVEDTCSLPPETGPCEALIKRYFHNSTSSRCEQFIYGGCDGNSNNFLTKSSCEDRCVDLCSLPPETGPCRAYIPRYFHNSTTKQCKKFIYGGCLGNSNNFNTRESCEEACDVLSPCAAILCPNGFRCEILNGEAFCSPDCSLNNGGCLPNQTCRIKDVVCVRAPCPPTRICEDRDPCATVRCANGFRCKVSNGIAFCDPDCNLNNGGCPLSQTCRLQNVTCVRQPCPPARICDCPPQCSKTFCQKNRKAICSNPGPREIPGCTGSCQLTYCRACYFAPIPLPRPGRCRRCNLSDYQSNTLCFLRWSRCIRKAHRKKNSQTSSNTDDNFRCYSPECPLRG